MTLIALIALATTAGSANAQDDQSSLQPKGMPVSPGQYDGFLDWVHSQHWAMAGIQDKIVTEYYQCILPEMYQKMEAGERAIVDAAARSRGMTDEQFGEFLNGVRTRIGQGYWPSIINGCKPQFTKLFFALKRRDETL
jgi:hypothetical protein